MSLKNKKILPKSWKNKEKQILKNLAKRVFPKAKNVETKEKLKKYEENKEKLLNLIFLVLPENEKEMVKFSSLPIKKQVDFLSTEIEKKLVQQIPSSGENFDANGFYG